MTLARLLALCTTPSLRRTSFYFGAIGLLCWCFADIEVGQVNPWYELQAMGRGLLSPRVDNWAELLAALLHTLAFALQGIVFSALFGFALALFYQRRAVRLFAGGLRSIHEVFWALLLAQIFGLTSLTGLLAIALPYTGTLAKIYGEQLEESDLRPWLAIATGRYTSFSEFLFCRLPLTLAPMANYTSYRLECALRSSVVLGFIGLPTLGFILETALRQGDYSNASALIYCLIGLVLSLRWWLKPLPLLIAVPALFWLVPIEWHWQPQVAWQFLTVDIVPAPWRFELTAVQASQWWRQLLFQQLLPGTVNTLLLSQIVLVTTGVVALLALPLNSPHFSRGGWRFSGDAVLILLRTLPEYLLNFICLIVLGPSMLPAIIAMTTHNGAIIAHLVGRHSEQLPPPALPSNGFNRYCFYVVPQLYKAFLAYLFYRWEIIMRETAMLGVLGIPTLGFYIDSAFERLQFDIAILLILATSLLTLCADQLAHQQRRQLSLKTTPEVR